MPRYKRLFVPHMPLHIVQRGHDRKPVFVQPADFRYYLANLREARQTYSVKVFGYCLMTNHVHLIVTPGANVEGVSALIRVLAARQTRYVNKLEQRTGTLWEGRFKSSLIDSDRYLLACLRYVELNPVRAGMVSSPGDYPWSSYRGHTEHIEDECLDECATYHALGDSEPDRRQAYAKWVSNEISEDELDFIRTALRRNQVTGGNRFRKEISARLHRRISALPPGRPAREK